PDQPRFEPDYQPLDFGEKSQEDFDSGDAEEWRRWEGLDEVEDANKAWREGEGLTFEPVEEARKDDEDEVEVELGDKLDADTVEAIIEAWRAIEA
ncbi:hypothetical protein JCM8097_008722, partial [Rhodosporidiobolus ruineniae]